MYLYEYINPKAVHGLMGVEARPGIQSNGLGVETHACLRGCAGVSALETLQPLNYFLMAKGEILGN